MWYSDRAYYWVCVLIMKDIDRRLPVELQCCSLYQGQQGDVNQSVRGNCKKKKNGFEVRSKISSKIIFAAGCVWYSDRAYYWVCVLIMKDIDRRLPVELQCCSLYQGQQGDVYQSVRGNCKKKKTFLRGTKSYSCCTTRKSIISLSSKSIL